MHTFFFKFILKVRINLVFIELFYFSILAALQHHLATTAVDFPKRYFGPTVHLNRQADKRHASGPICLILSHSHVMVDVSRLIWN